MKMFMNERPDITVCIVVRDGTTHFDAFKDCVHYCGLLHHIVDEGDNYIRLQYKTGDVIASNAIGTIYKECYGKGGDTWKQ